MSPFGDAVASVPLQRVRGQDSQVAEQQGAGTRAADQDVAAKKLIRMANPDVLRARERISSMVNPERLRGIPTEPGSEAFVPTARRPGDPARSPP